MQSARTRTCEGRFHSRSTGRRKVLAGAGCVRDGGKEQAGVHVRKQAAGGADQVAAGLGAVRCGVVRRGLVWRGVVSAGGEASTMQAQRSMQTPSSTAAVAGHTTTNTSAAAAHLLAHGRAKSEGGGKTRADLHTESTPHSTATHTPTHTAQCAGGQAGRQAGAAPRSAVRQQLIPRGGAGGGGSG